MNTFGLIGSFATGTKYIVTRRVRGSYVKGREVDATPMQLAIQGSVQPATGQDLLRLEEGRRTQETRTLFTTTKLYAGGQSSAWEADRITVDGQLWEVQQIQTWESPDSATFYRCILQAANT